MTPDQVIDYTLANGGGTFSLPDLEPYRHLHGYAVAYPGQFVMRATALDRQTVLEAAHWARSATWERPTQAGYLGTWVRPDGRVELEAASIVESKPAAIALANARYQSSIYSFAEQRVLPVLAPILSEVPRDP